MLKAAFTILPVDIALRLNRYRRSEKKNIFLIENTKMKSKSQLNFYLLTTSLSPVRDQVT